MADDPENHTLRLLQQMREENAEFRKEVRERFNAMDARLEAVETKLDKLSVDVLGVRGRIRKVEENIETIARVMSANA
jgi:hypothetical protein